MNYGENKKLTIRIKKVKSAAVFVLCTKTYCIDALIADCRMCVIDLVLHK